MDLQKIGCFLAELRHEQGLTQEQLGQELGVSGKTISRWETGTYLPPVEMLLLLSQRYHVPMNDLVLGERSQPEALAERAEEAVTQALQAGPFLLKDRQTFWKEKWEREHGLWWAFLGILIAVVMIIGWSQRIPWLLGVDFLVSMVLMLAERNRMLAYVERHVFDESQEE